ncbi:hypothetical protein BJX62DRAFT_241197 [Aspergillus germanicus]
MARRTTPRTRYFKVQNYECLQTLLKSAAGSRRIGKKLIADYASEKSARDLSWMLSFDSIEILDEIREMTTRYHDIAIPTFKKRLAERINICHRFYAYFHAVPYDVAWHISIVTPCYKKTGALPVEIVPWLAHHRVSRRTPINIQAPLETLAHGSIRRDILVCGATAHSIPGRKDLVRRAIVVAVGFEVAGISNRAVGSSGTRWSRRGRASGRGGGGASDGALPVLLLRAVWVLYAVRVTRVQEVRVLLERGAGAEEACAASTTTGASASRNYPTGPASMNKICHASEYRNPPPPSQGRAELTPRGLSLATPEREDGEYDSTGDFETDCHCDGYIYNVRFIPAGAPAASVTYSCYMQHVCLVLTYDASSWESWDQIVAVCERMRGRCKDGVLPYFATMIAAAVDEGIGEEGIGVGESPGLSRVEATAFAAQRGFYFVEFSLITGRGICDTVGSLVELANGVRDQYTMKKDGEAQRYKRAQEIMTVFAC